MRFTRLAALIGMTLLRPLGAAAQSATAAPPAPVPAASASPAATASAWPGVDPAITVRAKEWLGRVQRGNIDRSQLDSRMNELFTDDLVKAAAAKFGPLGEPNDFRIFETKTDPGKTAYVYHVTFASGSLYWVFALDAAGKINGLRFLPDRGL